MIDSITHCTGLVTQYNPLATAPGALIRADNCVINRENVIENRRGYFSYLTLSNSINNLLVYSSKIIAHNGTTLTYDNSGSPANYAGNYSSPSGAKIRSIEAFQNLYFTTSQGVQVLTDTAGTAARNAGAPRSLDPSYILDAANTGFLAAGSQCAYRVVIQRKDANGNILFGYPSTRLVAFNVAPQVTGTIANASNQITGITSTAGIAVGMTVTGQGFPAGTTVTALTSTTVTLSNNATVTSVTTTANTTTGSNQLASVASSVGILSGMVASGTGIPAGAIVTAVNSVTSSGSTSIDVGLSSNATATATGVSVTFSQATTGLSYSFGYSKNIDLTLYLPAEVTTSDTIQFYRTAQYSGTASDASGDEMALVYQYAPTSTDITNGYISVTDSVTDALRGATLYTSPSQEGIQQASDRPPLCKDLALYRNDYMVYANTSTKQRQLVTLIGVSGLTGNTLTIAGTAYSFGATETASTGTVAVGATGVVAADIDSTARSLVRVINRYATNTSVYAYYTSGPTDLPGQIMIEERGIGGAAFTTQVNNSTIAAMFSNSGNRPPVSPATSSSFTSSNQANKNWIMYSKAKQPEAVPVLNYYPVGAASKNILRIMALRESLIIIKEEGVYRLTGDTPQSFLVTPLDLTTFCKSQDSVALLANTCIMASNQGVVQISDTGVQVISRPIENVIKPLTTFSNFASNTFGVAYESERTYMISTITASTDAAANQVYVYNIFTKAWTHWTFGFNAAIVEPAADVIYYAKPSQLIVYKERKSFTDVDFADPESSITITAINYAANTVTFTITGASPQVGWDILQGQTDIPILSVSGTSGTYTAVMNQPVPASWTTGAATIYPPVGLQIVWNTWTGGAMSAGMLKQVSEMAFLTDNTAGNNSATVILPTFTSNFDENEEDITIALSTGGWGGSWGNVPWGGAGDSHGYRTFVPRNKQICQSLNPGMKHQGAREHISITGCAFQFEVLSERISR